MSETFRCGHAKTEQNSARARKKANGGYYVQCRTCKNAAMNRLYAEHSDDPDHWAWRCRKSRAIKGGRI